MVRDNNLLDNIANEKMHCSFAMQHANELWQADTMHGPYVHDNNGNMKPTFLIAFIDNYTSKEILQACVRLDIKLSHAPVRDGAAKGKIERFFRGFRDRFLIENTFFSGLSELNVLAQQWIELSGIALSSVVGMVAVM